jgi:hypothetical protein
MAVQERAVIGAGAGVPDADGQVQQQPQFGFSSILRMVLMGGVWWYMSKSKSKPGEAPFTSTRLPQPTGLALSSPCLMLPVLGLCWAMWPMLQLLLRQ